MFAIKIHCFVKPDVIDSGSEGVTLVSSGGGVILLNASSIFFLLTA